MLVDIGKARVLNVWEESGTDRDTGREFFYYRALLNVEGEPPLQVGVSQDDFESAKACVGKEGVCILNIDAQPGRKAKIRFCGMQ